MTTPSPQPQAAEGGRSPGPDPKVSIGMPVHQAEADVDGAIRSVRVRSGDFALVFSDDGSDGATEEICRRHAAEDPRITYHRSSEHPETAWNLRRLVGRTRAPYFAWAAHDLLHPEHLVRCVPALDADPGVVVVHPRGGTIDDDGVEQDTHLGHDLPLLVELAFQGGYLQAPDVPFRHRDDVGRPVRACAGARDRIERRSAWPVVREFLSGIRHRIRRRSQRAARMVPSEPRR